MLLTVQDFSNVEDYELPNLDKREEAFNKWCDKKERDIVRKILGPFFLRDLLEALALEPVPTKWLKIINGSEFVIDNYPYNYVGLKETLRPYIFSEYLRKSWGQVTDDGLVVVPQNESSEYISPADKIVSSYNDFVHLVGKYWYTDNTLYGYLGSTDGLTFSNVEYFELETINKWNI